MARGVFLVGDKGSSASYGSRYNFNPVSGLGLASTNYTSNGDSPYIAGNFGPPANGGHGYSMGSSESGVQSSSTNYQGPQSFDPMSGLTSSASQQVRGVTPFVRGFSNIGHTYSGPYSETLINYTYPTNHVRPHAVTSRDNGDTFTYDANGNMTQRVQNSVTWTQAFNAENHLTSVSDGTTTTQYIYDGNGNRVKRIVGTTTTVYVAGMEIELHSGTEDHRTIYYAAGGAFRIVGGSNAGLYFRHTDHLGSTSVLSDSNGNKVANSDVVYAPFGEVRVGSLSPLTDLGYTGQHLDRSTDGLMYYGARYYLPGLNRFISPDTIISGAGDPQGLNRYAYVYGNPVKYTDPTGHVEVLEEDKNSRAYTTRDYQRDLTKDLQKYDVRVKFDGGTALEKLEGLMHIREAVEKMAEKVRDVLNSRPHATQTDEYTAFREKFGPSQINVIPGYNRNGQSYAHTQNDWYAYNNGTKYADGTDAHGRYQIYVTMDHLLGTGTNQGVSLIAHELAHNLTQQGFSYPLESNGSNGIFGVDASSVNTRIYDDPNTKDVNEDNGGIWDAEQSADAFASWALSSYNYENEEAWKRTHAGVGISQIDQQISCLIIPGSCH